MAINIILKMLLIKFKLLCFQCYPTAELYVFIKKQICHSLISFSLIPHTQNNSGLLTCYSHRFSSRGPKPISLVFCPSPCLNLQQPSDPLILPPKMTMTDLATKQSICISLTPSLIPSLLWM